MSYDLLFRTEGDYTFSRDTIREWFHGRTGYATDTEQAVFTSAITGFIFKFSFVCDPDENAVAKFSVTIPAPEIIVEEIDSEVGAFANHFRFSVWDQQLSDGAFGPHDRERLLRDFAKYNRHMHSVHFGHLARKADTVVPRDVWQRVWLWNSRTHRIRKEFEQVPDAPFVPQILFVRQGEKIATAITMPGPMDIFLPEVDYIITAVGHIAFQGIKFALDSSGQVANSPVRHWMLSPIPTAVAEAMHSALISEGLLPMPAAQGILVEELVTEALNEFNLNRDEQNRMKSAVLAYNSARYAEALDLCRGYRGQYASVALMLQGVVQGELAQYDQCLQSLQTYLMTNSTDAMVWNSYGYFLCAVQQNPRGQSAYATALKLIEAELQNDPENAALWGRKAYALLGLNQPVEGLIAVTKGIEIEPENSLILQHCGRANLDLGQWQDAKEYLEKAIALDEHNPYARFYLAKVLLNLGHVMEAQAQAARIITVSPHLKRKLAELLKFEPL